MRGPLKRLAPGWNSFWFTPQSTAPLAILRIAFGLLATAWMLALTPDLLTFFGPTGILPDRPPTGVGAWSLLTLSSTGPVVIVLWLFSVIAAVALTLGMQTRLAALVLFVGILSFERRNGLVFNGGDGLMRNLALFLALSPAGVALSWDRWRERPDQFWEFPLRAPWALRLIQVQLSVVYLSTVWSKLQGELWGGGSAVTYAVRIGDIQRIPTPAFLTDSVVLTELMTFGTLGLEFSLGVLIWNRAVRPWVMALGVLFHLSIELSMMVGFFSLAMLCAYLAFLSPVTAARLVLAARNRGRRWRATSRWTRRPLDEAEPGPAGGERGLTSTS